jgi:hypothetical protein
MYSNLDDLLIKKTIKNSETMFILVFNYKKIFSFFKRLFKKVDELIITLVGINKSSLENKKKFKKFSSLKDLFKYNFKNFNKIAEWSDIIGLDNKSFNYYHRGGLNSCVKINNTLVLFWNNFNNPNDCTIIKYNDSFYLNLQYLKYFHRIENFGKDVIEKIKNYKFYDFYYDFDSKI